MNDCELGQYLSENSYPGRGILFGRSEDGSAAVTAYFIMGRSVNSRNRIFETTDDGIRTRAHDPSLMSDPSLIIYHPVRETLGGLIVTNGDQTDTIRDTLAEGKTFEEALETRTFEPDEPNLTPRISGLLKKNGGYVLSILKSENGDETLCRRYFYRYYGTKPGTGHLIHTYQQDGEPLPSFQGEPRLVNVSGDIKEFGDRLWNALNPDNKVSLFVRFTPLHGDKSHTLLYNKHQ